MLPCMDETAKNYDLCIKKVSAVYKKVGKEERAQRKNSALSMYRLWASISKQTQTTETRTEDLERAYMGTADGAWPDEALSQRKELDTKRN